MTLDNTKTDAPAMNAVLYEIKSYSADHLDGTNLLTSDKIVAIASVKDAGERSEYTAFNVNFEYKMVNPGILPRYISWLLFVRPVRMEITSRVHRVAYSILTILKLYSNH